MLKYLCAVTFGVSLAVTSSAHAMDGYADPFGGTVYHLVNCAASPARCAAFQATNGAPPANYLDGFGPAVFIDFLTANGITVYPDLLDLEIKGVSSNGTVYGTIYDEWPGSTQFIFQDGVVSCCIVDEPFMINDLNDNGYFVGMDYMGRGYVSGYIDWLGYIESVPTFDPASQAILDSLFFPWSWDFLAIDNDNVILAENLDAPSYPSPRYLFVPKALIPEPGSSSMVTTGLIALFLFRKRRSRTFPTVR